MTKSRNVIFVEAQRAILQEQEVAAPGPGQVLVRSRVTLISTGTELAIFRGGYAPGSVWDRMGQYPCPTGYSNVGEVIAVGAGQDAARFKPGDVVFSWGNHGQYVLASTKKMAHIPEGISEEEAVFGTIAQITLGGIYLSEIALGEAVVLIGAGILGQMTLQFARCSGAIPAIVVDLSPERLAYAAKRGADFTICPEQDDLGERVRQITKGRMADVVFEITGNAQVIPEALKLLKERGRLILLGSPGTTVELDFCDLVHSPGVRIIGAHNRVRPADGCIFNQWTQQRHLELFFDLLKSGRVQVKDLITQTFPWTDAPRAYDMLLNDRSQTLGVLLDWRSS